MKILCLNTAFKTAQLACEFEGEKAFKEIDAEAKSSENVLPVVENVLSSNNLTPEDLTHIGVVTGPGSFTGLRIGVAIVKGFACVFPFLKIISVNSLDLMAFQYVQENGLKQENIQKNEFYCVLNALSGRYFLAKYNKDGERIGECLLTDKLPENAILVGLECENLTIASESIGLEPKNLLDLVKKYIDENKITSLEELNPFYLRLSQAEENLIKGKLKGLN